MDLGILNKKNPIVPLLYKFEKWLYTKADQVVFSMEGGRDYIIDKKWDTDHGGPIDLKKVFYINNGVVWLILITLKNSLSCRMLR